MAAASPVLVDGVRWAYAAAGGEAELGRAGATALRLVLSAVVLLPATVPMGGTLPAIVRAAESEGDAARRRLGLLYGANTLGAVIGAAVATFFMIEIFGVRDSLWIAALLGALVGVLARSVGRRGAGPEDGEAAARPEAAAAPDAPADAPPLRAPAPVPLVYGAAFVTGFAFFAMEIVWYRMLGPLLGGSVYGFGLVLVLALVGIGLGARLYGRGNEQRVPDTAAFGWTCALEALGLGAPLWIGDDLVAVAYGARHWNLLGFDGIVAGWTLVAAVLVLIPSLVAGYQFPVLVGLLGRGRAEIGRQVGTAYLWNTAGAIAGSLVAGFGMLQVLGAVGMWRALVWVLVALAAIFAAWPGPERRRRLLTALPAALAVAAALAVGPTAAWRHSPVGAGRLRFPSHDPVAFERFLRDTRREVVWEADGVEVSFAVTARNAYSFLVTGKSDGNAKSDAPTVVMISLIGAAVHPAPETALVVGLGTGTSAGWLADVPGIERVDVVELEPRIADFARMCGPVNRNLFDKDNVTIHFGDAREFLSSSHRTYDVVVSEPSNPYRVGIASLFSRDFYLAARERMSDDGVFVQWFQAYEVDGRALRTAVATLSSVFPAVEIWATREGDLALVAYRDGPKVDPERLAERLAAPVFREGLYAAWGTVGLEGLLAGYLAAPEVARTMAEDAEDLVDTDDRPVLEFGFQRTLGSPYRVRTMEILALAHALEADRPGWYAPEEAGALWDARSVWSFEEAGDLELPDGVPDWVRAHHASRRAYASRAYAQAIDRWLEGGREPVHPADLRRLAWAGARTGRPEAEAWIEALDAVDPVDARFAAAYLAAGRGEREAAVVELARGFERARTDPWFSVEIAAEALALARKLGLEKEAAARRLFEALAEPFAVAILQERRYETRVALAARADWPGLCREALAPYEPHAPWQQNLLAMRVRCYEEIGDEALLERAQDDFDRYWAMRPERISDLIDR